MQLKSITSAKDAGIPGIEFVKTDKSITEVIIGGKLRIRKGESYQSALQVLIEQPFEEAKRFRTTATIEGFDPKVSYHDGRWEADQAAQALIAKGADATVEEVTVHLDDSGQVVGEAGNPATVATDSDLPF